MTDYKPLAFVSGGGLPVHNLHRARPVSLSPSTYPGARLPLRRPRSRPPLPPHRTSPTAVFLPPNSIPHIPDDDDRAHDDAGMSDTDLDSELSPPDTPPPPKPTHQLNTIDQLLEETVPEYETWVERNARRSLTTFRGGSEWTLGAEELNESLRPSFLQRHRHVLAPDEAFGALFMWNVVVSNARELELLAWRAVAEEKRLMPPDMDDIVRAEDMAPEAAVSRVFFWTQDWGEVKRCVFRKQEVMAELEETFAYTPRRGIEKWLEMLERYGMPCILCASGQPKERVGGIVGKLGLGKYFSSKDMVSSEDEFDSLEQMLLVGALKSSRPPGKCVVFTDKPKGITAGHEVSAKVVGLIGAHPAYEMKTADQLVTGYDELVVYNIRRLFSEEGMEMMDAQTQLEFDRME